MEDGSITDDQITASSYYGDNEPGAGRLNNDGQWSAKYEDSTGWIQVKFSSAVTITAIQTQGSVAYWVKELQIQTGDSEDSLSYIMDGKNETVSIWY